MNQPQNEQPQQPVQAQSKQGALNNTLNRLYNELLISNSKIIEKNGQWRKIVENNKDKDNKDTLIEIPDLNNMISELQNYERIALQIENTKKEQDDIERIEESSGLNRTWLIMKSYMVGVKRAFEFLTGAPTVNALDPEHGGPRLMYIRELMKKLTEISGISQSIAEIVQINALAPTGSIQSMNDQYIKIKKKIDIHMDKLYATINDVENNTYLNIMKAAHSNTYTSSMPSENLKNSSSSNEIKITDHSLEKDINSFMQNTQLMKHIEERILAPLTKNERILREAEGERNAKDFIFTTPFLSDELADFYKQMLLSGDEANNDMRDDSNYLVREYNKLQDQVIGVKNITYNAALGDVLYKSDTDPAGLLKLFKTDEDSFKQSPEGVQKLVYLTIRHTMRQFKEGARKVRWETENEEGQKVNIDFWSFPEKTQFDQTRIEKMQSFALDTFKNLTQINDGNTLSTDEQQKKETTLRNIAYTTMYGSPNQEHKNYGNALISLGDAGDNTDEHDVQSEAYEKALKKNGVIGTQGNKKETPEDPFGYIVELKKFINNATTGLEDDEKKGFMAYKDTISEGDEDAKLPAMLTDAPPAPSTTIQGAEKIAVDDDEEKSDSPGANNNVSDKKKSSEPMDLEKEPEVIDIEKENEKNKKKIEKRRRRDEEQELNKKKKLDGDRPQGLGGGGDGSELNKNDYDAGGDDDFTLFDLAGGGKKRKRKKRTRKKKKSRRSRKKRRRKGRNKTKKRRKRTRRRKRKKKKKKRSRGKK
jgi:hypothetical protein